MNSGQLALKLRRQCIIKLSALLREELINFLEKEIHKKKRIWVRKWIRDRYATGASALILKQLRLEDPSEDRLALRLTAENFDVLLSLIENSVQRQDTMMRDALPAKIKLEITLTYLCTGMNYRSLSHFNCVSKHRYHNVYQKCVGQREFSSLETGCESQLPMWPEGIYTALKQFIKVPSTAEEWGTIEEGFRTRWNGVIDGKHVAIKAAKSGSNFFNYKEDNSIILLAIVDHDYCFSYIDVGASGSASDGGIIKNCSMYQQLENGLLPEDGVIVEDAAFPLKKYLMTLYRDVNLDTEQKVFNYRLAQARILVNRFRTFEKPILTNLETVNAIVCATCALHNYLRKKSELYITATCVDREEQHGNFVPGSRRNEITALESISSQGSNHSANIAIIKRELYNFFC